MNHALHGSQTPTTAFVPSSMGITSDDYFDDGNLLEAKILFQKGLNEAGIKKHSLPQLKLSYASSDKNHRIAQVLQQQWLETLDLKVDLEALEPPRFIVRFTIFVIVVIFYFKRRYYFSNN